MSKIKKRYILRYTNFIFGLLFSILAINLTAQEKSFLCRSNLLPLDLNKELGISFAPGSGAWYNEDGEKISNVFVFPQNIDDEREFKFVYKITNTRNACVDNVNGIYEVRVSIKDLERPSGNSRQLFCYIPDSVPTIDDIIVNGNNVKWYSSLTSDIALDKELQLQNNTTYYASSTLAGCGESMERLAVQVIMGISPDIEFETDNIESFVSFNIEQFGEINDIHNTSGRWSYYSLFPDTINDPKSLIVDPIITESQLIYALKSTDVGCYDIDSIQVIIKDDLIIPRAFTPNNDGKNDQFVIQGLESYPNNELIVANRYGAVVYRTKNYENNWDGVPNTGIVIGNGVLPEGTYFYVLKLSGAEKIIRDYVYIKR